jgi:hypothetical protein
MRVKIRNAYQILVEKPHLGNLNTDWRAILNESLRKWDVRAWAGFI